MGYFEAFPASFKRFSASAFKFDKFFKKLAGAIVALFLVIAALLKQISELKGAPKTPGIRGNAIEIWEGLKRNTFLHVAGTIFLLFFRHFCSPFV